MVELRLSNIISIGLAALIFFMVVKYILRRTSLSGYAEFF